MAIAVDATASSGGSGGQTKSFTVGSVSNRLLVVTTTGDNNKITGVQWNGNALTLSVEEGPENGRFAQVWYLEDPESGTFNVTTDKPDGSGNDIGIISFEDASEPITVGATQKEEDGDLSISVTPQGDAGFVVDALGHNGLSSSLGADQTEIFNDIHGGEAWCSSYESHTGSAVTMSWSSNPTISAHVGAEVKTAEAAADTDAMQFGCNL